MENKSYHPSSVILRKAEWYFRTDVSGQPNGPIFKNKAVQKEGVLRQRHASKQRFVVGLVYITVKRVAIFHSLALTQSDTESLGQCHQTIK
jgi:hypothetical protein